MDTLRKRLLYRSEHRGMREACLILGGYARAHVPEMTEGQLHTYQALLEHPDQDLLNWCLGLAPVPVEHQSDVMEGIRDYVKSTS